MPGPLAVTLYRAQGCGLCARAEAILARLARELPIAVTAVDISSDPALEARYFLEIPVIEAGGCIIARAPIAEVALRAELEALLAAP